MNYTIDDVDTSIAYIEPESNITSMLTTLPNVNTFIFQKGNFYLDDILVLDRNNIVLKSLYSGSKYVHIYQTNSSKDGIVVNANNVKISSLSIHDNYSGKIALTVAGSNYVTIESCNIYGSDDTFSVYFAGPKNLSAGQSTLDAYAARNLDNINVFRRNVVYTKWSGDSVSFSLQKNGIASSNIIRGGKLAVYMCANCSIERNIIYDSVSNGIHLSFPSNNIIIDGNTIYECQSSGIKLSNQVEHGTFTPSDYNISIICNTIYDSKYYAIELNNAIGILIDKNKFSSTDIYGIYAYQSQNLRIVHNIISYFTVAVWLESASDIYIYENEFNNVYPDQSNNVVKFVDCTTGVVYDNKINGEITYDIFPVTNSTGITIGNNISNLYYSYDEELRIIKLK